MKSNIAKLRQRLEARLLELDQIEVQGEDERATVSLDQQAFGRVARVDLLQRQELAKETHRRRQLERRSIIAALSRMDEDEYGWCVECGDEIPVRRLEINPTSALCVHCASEPV